MTKKRKVAKCLASKSILIYDVKWCTFWYNYSANYIYLGLNCIMESIRNCNFGIYMITNQAALENCSRKLHNLKDTDH